LPSALETASAPGDWLSRLNGWPMPSPTDASSPSSRTSTHAPSIASEGQQPTLNDQGVTVAKRVRAGRATAQTLRMEGFIDMLSLVEAARKIGITTLAKAIKSGRLSVSRKEDGSYEIDPAELARVYSFSAPSETATAAVPTRVRFFTKPQI
jgi:hypothetical protein